MTGGEFNFTKLVDNLINKEDIDKIPGLVRKLGPENI